jgi:hypothetical protein
MKFRLVLFQVLSLRSVHQVLSSLCFYGTLFQAEPFPDHTGGLRSLRQLLAYCISPLFADKEAILFLG